MDKKILVLLLSVCTLFGASAQISTFPSNEGFAAFTTTTGTNLAFVPNWTANEVAATSRVFRDRTFPHNDTLSLGVIPTSGFSGDIRASLDMTGLSNLSVSFWAKSEANGGTRPAVLYCSVSIDGGLSWINNQQIADSNTFVQSSTPYVQYTYNFPVAANNQANVLFRMMVTRGNIGSGTAAKLYLDDFDFTASASDVTPPTVVSLSIVDHTHLVAVYSEPVSGATATNIANYTGFPVISGITQNLAQDTAFITLSSPLVDGTYYNVTIDQVADLSSNVMAAPYNTSLIINTTLPDIILTEIMYNPPGSGTDTLEFIEIYNRGTVNAELGGLYFSAGVTYTFPQYTLAPGTTYLLAVNKPVADLFYGVTFNDQWSSGALSNSGELLQIVNTQGISVDSVNFSDSSPWPVGPPSPDGGGPSIVIVDYNQPDYEATNWTVATNFVGIENATNVYATPGLVPAPPVTPTVAINQAMYTVNESAGTVNVAVSITNANGTASIVKVNVISGSTATDGTDFTVPALVTFPGNVDTTIHVVITLTDDVLAERTEYIGLIITDSANVQIGGTDVCTVYIKDNDFQAPVGNGNIQLEVIGTYSVGGSNSAEISAFDPTTNRMYIANSVGNTIEVVDMTDPRNITLITSVDISSYGAINSITVWHGIVAAAIENSNPQANGHVVFFDSAGVFLNQVTVGAMPDMICFTPDHSKVLTANEGEPDVDYNTDPEGSVSIIDISGGVLSATVNTVGFTSFNGQIATLRASGIRIFGPGSTVAQDLEPEYITVDSSSSIAWITLQENNALAKLDIISGTITDIYPLGFKDHSLPGNAMDISNTSGDILIANWPVKGMYMPDAIASYTVGGNTFLVTANEGDAREYNPLNEAVRIGSGSYTLDASWGDFSKVLKPNNNAGRLNATIENGDGTNDGDFDTIYVFGSRSFSVWDANGNLVWDSGDDFEQITAVDPTYGSIFNCSNDNVTQKNRSDDKGPEPEGITTGIINDTVYAFITLERVGGVMVYDVTNPNAPQFVQYINNRSTSSATGDLGPEGIFFVSDANSPIDTSLLVVSNEVSATVTVYKINHVVIPVPVAQFVADDNSVCEGTTVQYTDQTSGTPVSWEWTFAGGTPGNSNVQNPSVVYNTPGTYNVQLVVANSLGDTDTLIMASYITVNALPSAPTVTQINATTIQSSQATGNQWNNTGGPISGATSQTYTPPSNGAYTVTYTDANGCSATSAPVNFVNTTGIEGNEASTFSVFPNPVQNTLYMSQPVAVKVVDLTGKVVLVQTSSMNTLSVETLSPGVYILQTENGKQVRFIKQ